MQERSILWKDEYNIGVEIIDKAHRRLFTTARRLVSLVEQRDKMLWACKEGLEFFKNYTLNHFAEEEAYMGEAGYADFEMHRRMHEEFRTRTIPALEKQLLESNYSPAAIRRALGVCIGWLTGHIMMEDQAIAGRGRKRWIYTQAATRLEALENAIVHVMRQMFGLEAEIVTANYSGERLDAPLYYALHYANEAGDTLESVFIVEEELILETTGAMVGLRFQSVNEIVLSSVREITQIILQQVSYCLGMQNSGYRFSRDALLTSDDVAARFAENPPLCSLLFQTSAGCFALCIDAKDAAGREAPSA